MERKDLKVGNIVTMRNGNRAVVARNESGDRVFLYENGGFDLIDAVDTDLTGSFDAGRTITEVLVYSGSDVWVVSSFLRGKTIITKVCTHWKRSSTIEIDGKTIELSAESFEALRKQLI